MAFWVFVLNLHLRSEGEDGASCFIYFQYTVNIIHYGNENKGFLVLLSFTLRAVIDDWCLGLKPPWISTALYPSAEADGN